jgi:hypothetical protein
MQPITIIQDPTYNAQSTHTKTSKTSHVNHAMGSICTKACFAQAPGYSPHNLGLVDHWEPLVPPAPPLKRLLQPRVLHASYAHSINVINL